MNIRNYIGIIVPLIISAAGLLSMSLIAHFLQNGILPLWIVSKHQIINFTFTMQLMVLPISFIAIMLTWLYDKSSFKIFFKLKLFPSGISTNHQQNWKLSGPIIAIAFTLGTTLFMSASVALQEGAINQKFLSYIPWVILFAVMNAWSEEIFSRFVVVSGLFGKANPTIICWMSAILFGIPHFIFGTPNGIFGVIMSGFLGWWLAKSVIETRSLGWALLIHILQDLVIFGAGAMILAGLETSQVSKT